MIVLRSPRLLCGGLTTITVAITVMKRVVKFDFQHGYSEWRNLEYGKEYETAKPQFGLAVL